MSRTASRRPPRGRLLYACALLACLPASGAAQTPQAVVSSEIEMSRQAASLRLELEDGRRVAVTLQDGRVLFDERDLGAAPRSGELDRAWRELLNRAMDAQSAELPELFGAWTPPQTDAARRLAAELESLFVGEAVDTPATDASTAAIAPDVMNDSVARLRARIQQLERQVAEQQRRPERAVESRARTPSVFRPLRHVVQGLTGLFSLLVTYAVLFGVAVVAIFFGARPYIEGVADTARRATGRSFLVGIAGTFLTIPVFVLGVIALAISIVGIPALLVWIPLFPVAFAAACLLGYFAVAHAAGEGLAERRFTHETWFERGNSYYFILTGLGLLMAFFVAGHIVHMAGPWLGFIRGMLFFAGGVATWAAVTIGLGAVLVSRGGTRPVGAAPADLDAELFREEAGV